MGDARGTADQELAYTNLGHMVWRCRIRPGMAPLHQSRHIHPTPGAQAGAPPFPMLSFSAGAPHSTAQDVEIWEHVRLPIYLFHVCGKGLFLVYSLFAAASICQRDMTYGTV